MADCFRRGADDVQAHLWPHSRARQTVSPRTRCLARRLLAVGLFLDRARLSDTCCAFTHRLPHAWLFCTDLGRHGPVRQRDLAAARRALHRCIRHLRPLRANGNMRRPAETTISAATIWSGLDRSRADFVVDDGTRAAAFVERSLRRSDCDSRVVGRGIRDHREFIECRRARPNGTTNHLPGWILAPVPISLLDGEHRHECGNGVAFFTPADRSELRFHAYPYRPLLSPHALPRILSGSWAIQRSTTFRFLLLLPG